MNPTRKALQDCLAALEGGTHGLAFASGLAATDTVLRLLNADSHVLAGNDVYGGTFRLFDKVLRRFSLDFTFADTTDPESVAEALTPSTRERSGAADRKSTRLNSSHTVISYAVFCLKK